MYVYEYLSMQRKLAELKKQAQVWKPMREHLETIDAINIISAKIKSLILISNN